MGMTVEEQRIDLDYNRASAHAQKYIMPFLLQVQARAIMIESASRKFEEFTKLPASGSKVLEFVDFAWAIVSNAVPALKLVDLVRKANIAEDLTKASSAVGAILIQNTSPGKVTRATETVGKVKETVEKGIGIYEKGQTVVSDAPAVDAFAKLDTSKGPVKELFEDARKMVVKWNRTVDFLVEEKAARLTRPTVAYKQTMFSYATERLPALDVLSGPEMDQIEAEYLWHMIARYVRENADFSEARNGYRIHKGLNDTQQAAIVSMFGPLVRRGKYFGRPFFFDVIYYLHAFGARKREYALGNHTGANTGHGRMRQ